MSIMNIIFSQLKGCWERRNSESYIKSLRKKGIKIGNDCILRSPGTTRIDTQRPELITIGNGVDMNKNFQILTHDWCSRVFRGYYHDFINSTGRVFIGDNIYFGTDVIILGGVRIGNNCIIAAGSIVTRDIPDNSVAAGTPCRVICSLDEYYEKRKKKALSEAVERINCFIERFHRDPHPKELREEFIYYVNKSNVSKYESIGVPIRAQLREAYNDWLEKHAESMFPDFDSFIKYCKKQRNN